MKYHAGTRTLRRVTPTFRSFGGRSLPVPEIRADENSAKTLGQLKEDRHMISTVEPVYEETILLQAYTSVGASPKKFTCINEIKPFDDEAVAVSPNGCAIQAQAFGGANLRTVPRATGGALYGRSLSRHRNSINMEYRHRFNSLI